MLTTPTHVLASRTRKSWFAIRSASGVGNAVFSMSMGLMTLLLSLAVILPHWPAVQNEGNDARKQLYDYLLNECRRHFQHRRQEIEQLQSAEQIRQRQDRLRKQFVAALGVFQTKRRFAHR